MSDFNDVKMSCFIVKKLILVLFVAPFPSQHNQNHSFLRATLSEREVLLMVKKKKKGGMCEIHYRLFITCYFTPSLDQLDNSKLYHLNFINLYMFITVSNVKTSRWIVAHPSHRTFSRHTRLTQAS